MARMGYFMISFMSVTSWMVAFSRPSSVTTSRTTAFTLWQLAQPDPSTLMFMRILLVSVWLAARATGQN